MAIVQAMFTYRLGEITISLLAPEPGEMPEACAVVLRKRVAVNPTARRVATGRSDTDSIPKLQTGFAVGTVRRTASLRLVTNMMTIATIIMVPAGGAITAPLLYGLTGVGGDGMPGGGILPGVTTHITPVMNAMAQSTVTTSFRPTKS
jgi:hypothetical protein